MPPFLLYTKRDRRWPTVPRQDTGHLDQPQVVGGLSYKDRMARHFEKASPACAPPPIASPDNVSLLPNPSSPRRWAGVEGCSRGAPPPPELVACRSPCRSGLRSLLGAFEEPSTTIASMMSSSSLKSGMLAPAITTESGPPSASTKIERLTPSLALSVGLGPICNPKTGLAPSHRRPPPAGNPTPPSSSHSSTNSAQMRSSTPSSTHRWKVRCTDESSETLLASGSTGSRWQLGSGRVQGAHVGLCGVGRYSLAGRAWQGSVRSFSHNWSGYWPDGRKRFFSDRVF